MTQKSPTANNPLAPEVPSIQRNYIHPFLCDFCIIAETQIQECGKIYWRVTIWYKGVGIVRRLPFTVDIDIYAFAILHAVDFFQDKRSVKMKWNEKKITELKGLYPLSHQFFLSLPEDN